MTRTIDFNITKDRRKGLVNAIAEYVQEDPTYLGAPSFTYMIGTIRVDKAGLVTLPDIREQDLELVKFSNKFIFIKLSCK